MDFINGSYVKIKAAINSAGSAFTSLFPVPLFGAVSSPDIETSHKIQFTFSQAIKSVIDIIISKISSITNFISDTFHATIASVTFPTFPTIAAMTAAISAAFSAGSSSVSFSGFPSITIPSFGEIFSPVMQAVKALPMMFVDLMIGMLKPIVTFINDIASFFGSFTWPKLCINSNGYYAG